MESEFSGAILQLVKEGGPLAVSLVFAIGLYQLIGRLETRIGKLIDQLVKATKGFQDTNQKMAVAVEKTQEDIKQIRRSMENRRNARR